MTRYNWQLPDWPHFKYDLSMTYDKLLAIAEKMGRIQGKVSHLTEVTKQETLIDLMVEEAITTSAIEGEFLNRSDVRSSLIKKLGLKDPSRIHDKRAEGIAALMIDVRQTFQQTLTAAKLWDWHLLLLSSALNPSLTIGTWRQTTEPMQIVSGHSGKWVVHFEAPPAAKVPQEMRTFLKWFNQTAPGKPHAIVFAPVRAAIAHLYFESIHPFEDGNGRIGRAIAEKALSQGAGYPVMLSLSHTFEAEKKAYYAALHHASRSNEITPWLNYFIDVIMKAQQAMETQINFVLAKTVFLDTYQMVFNARQMKVIQRMLKTGIKGFEGGMSAKKYMSITGTSKATATRDLQHLLSIKAVKQIGQGRNVRYELNLKL